MSPLAYYALWLVLGLVAVAAVSAAFTRLMRRREQALVLAEALARHSVWVAAQRSRLELAPRRDEADAALQQAQEVQARWFPHLAPALATVMQVDQRIEGFLMHQRRLRFHDPEAWLESDHDQQFMSLWREYLEAIEGVTARLERATGEVPGFVRHGPV
ncbi:hypothetical protein [Ramlibacter rhizophilus]|uniref:DUF2489 domain-containing protein n=1 Tax=Ramlibacter rhizophilus TaxID=1781167 RepID=A0A4Z0BTJ3_9BURK|nr:hypothetical protein [Ramlibacter rhizophilus]TFZ01335.1 hypothetical protein EZ242_08110 [Ramlibacter rhizophilus]